MTRRDLRHKWMFQMAEVLHYGPTDIDALTTAEFDLAVEYVERAVAKVAQAQAQARQGGAG